MFFSLTLNLITMVSKRLISFPRQIFICLSLSVIAVICSLSCQKDQDLKAKDPRVLTKSEAKAYFEQTATTLKFLTATSGPAETKNQDYSLTENMVIEWDQALEGETSDSYVVEVPIRMASPVSALLYDGIGHLNKNIRQVQMNVSLVIEKHKDDGCFHHYVSTTVGSYSKSTANTKYGFLCDKTSFSGYQIFSNEKGKIVNSLRYEKGVQKSRKLFSEGEVDKIDNHGKLLESKGIAFIVSRVSITKGGEGSSSGESWLCVRCGHNMVVSEQSLSHILYYCPVCGIYTTYYIDPSNVCVVCGYPENQCKCCKCEDCTMCHVYPCTCQDEYIEPFNPSTCSLCGGENCDGNCQEDVDNTPVTLFHIVATVSPVASYGAISRHPLGNYIESGVTVTMTAIPNSGYRFVQWLKDSIYYSSACSISFTASSNNHYYAVFASN